VPLLDELDFGNDKRVHIHQTKIEIVLWMVGNNVLALSCFSVPGFDVDKLPKIDDVFPILCKILFKPLIMHNTFNR